MSSNDGNHNPHEDAYHYQQHPNMAAANSRDMPRSHHLQRQQPHVPDAAIPLATHPTHHQLMWANHNPNMMPPPLPPQQPQQHQFLPHLAAQHMQQTQLQQPPIPTHSQQQQQQQPHQRYNDYMFNMHPVQAYVQPTGQPETYSVLPVGHGNFLKVYHCNEAPPINDLANAGIFQQPPTATQSQPQSNQPSMSLQHLPMQTVPTQHRIQQQQQQYKPHVTGDISHQVTNPAATSSVLPSNQQPQQIFNSYELFSSNPLLPAACDNRNITLNLATPQDINSNNTITTTGNINTNNNQQQLNDGVNAVAVTTTNMIINKLVNNWSPNLTGVAYTQFSAPTPPLPAGENIETVIIKQENPQQQQQQQQQHQQVQLTTIDNNKDDDNKSTITETKILKPIASTATTTPIITTIPTTPNIDIMESTNVSNSIDKTAKNNEIGNSNKSNNNSISNNKNALAPEGKKRIVAEVKPMRMTYSDVLSKANHAQQQQQNVQNNNRNGKILGTAAQLLLNSERKSNNSNNNNNNNNNTTIPNNANKKAIATGGDVEGRTNKKSSPTHEQKENNSNKNNNNNNKRSNSSNNNNNNNGQNKYINQKSTTTITGKPPTIVNDILNNNSNTNNNNNNGLTNTKKRNNLNINNKKSTTNTANFNNNNNNNNSFMEKENEFGMRKTSASTAATTSTTTSSSNLNTKASGRNRSSGNSSMSNNSSYSYSKTQRNRNSYYGSASVGTSGGTYGSYGAATNRNYELAKKLLKTWCEYALKILTWLYYLVYDIVVISCSMAYDNLKQYAIDAWWTMCHLRSELKQNSNKPGLWWRNFWRRFDAHFSKNSRWAFWRRYFTKKPPTTATTETFKGGRLPQTGDEAMYSLLNCKGKNAYSILGVPPDSSQEQIRKHYKKIAVLVHPDKNKQAGAEEAFKVLQRAFELIGEPENRLAYDTSLAEALHAEKAWTEFHDLLSQLHTKITEAANTIRCSTCSLRHPRKLTDRPHYAARECASCKIRHSAREGDIWAESTMLGLRWKYLALMEGKVYDITEWANCQKGALSHLEPNSHMVQYRIVRGAQQQQQQQQQNSNQKQQRQQTPGFDSGGFGAGTSAFAGAPQFGNDLPSSEASLHEFLDNLYSGQNPNQTQSTSYSNSSRRRNRRN